MLEARGGRRDVQQDGGPSLRPGDGSVALGTAPDTWQRVLRVVDWLGTRLGVRRMSGGGDGDGDDAGGGDRVSQRLRVVSSALGLGVRTGDAVGASATAIRSLSRVDGESNAVSS